MTSEVESELPKLRGLMSYPLSIDIIYYHTVVYNIYALSEVESKSDEETK